MIMWVAAVSMARVPPSIPLSCSSMVWVMALIFSLLGATSTLALESQPPRPAGRGKQERKSPVHLAAEKLAHTYLFLNDATPAALASVLATVRGWRMPRP